VRTIFLDYLALPPGPEGKFMLTVRAAVAELEPALIAVRTKAALAVLKARGVKLGAARPECRNLTAAARRKGAAAAAARRSARAREVYRDIEPTMVALARAGWSWEAIGREISKEHTTPGGRRFTGAQVRRIVGRIAPELVRPRPPRARDANGSPGR
jgi:DNA invertase Pin-like site-specific DNA recombinase